MFCQRILHNCLSNSTNPAEGRIISSPVFLPELAKYLRTQVGLGKRPKSALCALVLLAAERALCQKGVTLAPLGTELVHVMASLTSCGTVGETDSSRLISACADWISSECYQERRQLHLSWNLQIQAIQCKD
ncbi:hypothetical protein IscW_ISCW009680 [Ixodes scapularis]|uniref:Uncharacterized protein n=1 Tax=Ixodes scapularis TaxID=6945 RepID=B7Q2A9_IXOSC|nr:hypothetical protein IscW_ISCW009680 [Ixodes scapularis]|eukprot:XP_002410640.1 hypothetical protein IscW_ISCW009680 [Ixodes scapularis]